MVFSVQAACYGCSIAGSRSTVAVSTDTSASVPVTAFAMGSTVVSAQVVPVEDVEGDRIRALSEQIPVLNIQLQSPTQLQPAAPVQVAMVVPSVSPVPGFSGLK
jgi:hypothetical protein